MANGPYDERLEGGGSYLPMLEGDGNLPMLEGGDMPSGMTENMFSNMELRGGGPSNLLNFARPIIGERSPIPTPHGAYPQYMSNDPRIIEGPWLSEYGVSPMSQQEYAQYKAGLAFDRFKDNLSEFGSDMSSGIRGLLGFANNNNEEIGQSGTGDNPKPKDYPQY
jgi:hypothetical protein